VRRPADGVLTMTVPTITGLLEVGPALAAVVAAGIGLVAGLSLSGSV
jgi:hypothetical protein